MVIIINCLKKARFSLIPGTKWPITIAEDEIQHIHVVYTLEVGGLWKSNRNLAYNINILLENV